MCVYFMALKLRVPWHVSTFEYEQNHTSDPWRKTHKLKIFFEILSFQTDIVYCVLFLYDSAVANHFATSLNTNYFVYSLFSYLT